MLGHTWAHLQCKGPGRGAATAVRAEGTCLSDHWSRGEHLGGVPQSSAKRGRASELTGLAQLLREGPPTIGKGNGW